MITEVFMGVRGGGRERERIARGCESRFPENRPRQWNASAHIRVTLQL